MSRYEGRISRRDALRAAGASAIPWAEPPGARLPTIPLGGARVTRLVAGGNPVWGFSHATPRLSRHMVDYFTPGRIVDFLLRCERAGIDTWQTSYRPQVRQVLLAAREKGSKIQFMCLLSERDDAVFQEILSLEPIALVHHGEVTDTAFREGRRDKVRDFVKKIKDTGLAAGVSTHSPGNLLRIEDSGWENDFYMACFYNIRRFTGEDLRRRLGDELLGELYLENDPVEMTRRMREVKKPCLGFKLLAAGRLCSGDEAVERAFAFAYRNIKPADGVVVGMFPIFFDEVGADAALARKYAAAS